MAEEATQKKMDDDALRNLVSNLYHSFKGSKPDEAMIEKLYAAASSVRTLTENGMKELAQPLLAGYIAQAAQTLSEGPLRDTLYELARGIGNKSTYIDGRLGGVIDNLLGYKPKESTQQ